MLESTPLVTVIIPTYNYGRYICEAIDSVLASSFPQSEIEIIVIDDGSTDDTQEYIRAYGDRIHYVFQDNQGKAFATKVGIDRAKGKYLFNLDADDILLPEKIGKVVSIFESDDEIVHVGHPALCWNINSGTQVSETLPDWLTGRKINGKEVLVEFYKKRILFGGGSTFAARTEILKGCSIPKEVDMYIDEHLVLVILNKGYSYFIEQPLSVWRIHGDNYSEADKEKPNSNVSRSKAERSMDSMNAVLSFVLSGDFESNIKKLYMLKAKVLRIAMKEQKGQKSYADVLDLWRYLISAFSVFGKDSFEIMRCYAVLNRTLPTPVLKLAKKSMGKSVYL
jgi:glycosyltransferase involved in cell wall biosynthesis